MHGQERPLNPWSVVALVTGILALFPVAIASAITALVQSSRRPYRGQGMAISGLVLGCLWVVLVGLGVLGFVLDSSAPGSGDLSQVGAVEVGTCLDLEDDGPAARTSCYGPHDGEVSRVEAVGSGDYPGADALDLRGDALCYGTFALYTGETWEDSDHDYAVFTPTRQDWAAGRTSTVCVVVSGLDDLRTPLREGPAR